MRESQKPGLEDFNQRSGIRKAAAGADVTSDVSIAVVFGF